MRIRKATEAEISSCVELYEVARGYMRANGNHVQWTGGYPSLETARHDFEQGHLYVCEEDGSLLACFTFFLGPDPAYARIEDGAWINDDPYWVMRRIAVGVQGRGVGSFCLHWIKEQCDNARAVTHELNAAMQAVFVKCGVARCGTIYTAEGSPRVAYQYVATEARLAS